MKLHCFAKTNHLTLLCHPSDSNIFQQDIRRISVVTFPGNLFWVKENDLVFIVLDLLSNEDRIKVFKSLIAKNITACCILPYQNKISMDKEIIKICEENKLPLFHFLKNDAYQAFLFQVLCEIMNKDNILAFIKQQLRNNIVSLMNTNYFHAENLIHLVSLFLQRECYLLSKQFNLLYHCSPQQKKLSFDLPLKKWSQELSDWYIDHPYALDPIIFDHEEQEYYCFPLKTEKQVIGYLCIEKIHRQFGDLDPYFIIEILSNFILSMINTSKNDLIHQKSIDEYLQNVLYGLFTDETTLKRETNYYHFDYYLNRYVWILQIQQLNKKMQSFENQVPNTILSKIKDLAEETFYQNSFLIEKSQIISIHVKDEMPNEKILTKLQMLLNNLEIQFPEYNFSIGISRSYRDMYSLKYAYQDATFSLIMGKILFSTTKKIFSYDDLLIHHFLYQQIDNPILDRLYMNTIQKIKIHDMEKQDHLYETLNEIIYCDFNLTQAHDNLYIHRNTLYQRIKKIEKIIGLSMKSSETKLLLQIGLKLDHIYNVINQSTMAH
ncbi:PucR family transcriptional regulator [Natronincola ferrireducens]|uniref:PucR C-terminal helix-turn-helix domain-containing protein n=1 Tax=Natronincola ferrireducens TaxID=393762 RepID=A0A1G9E560_9FIRM|nr:helix-turn-helix domain-containing protein [Natronincola ferrireducens]SDK71207.1 PucR C-terminal helix-turn-helix domain-containing protein [Natronincola ferrireducens]